MTQHDIMLFSLCHSLLVSRVQAFPFKPITKLWNLKPRSHSYLNRVTHETRSHFRSRCLSLMLPRIQKKYHRKIALIPLSAKLHFNSWFHVDNGSCLPVVYHILYKQRRFPPFNEPLWTARAITTPNIKARLESHGRPQGIMVMITRTEHFFFLMSMNAIVKPENTNRNRGLKYI